MNAQSVSYTADGTTAVYLFPFLIEESLDLEVLINGVTQTSGYAILGGEGANLGGAVRFDTAPGTGSAIILRRTGKVQVSPTDAPGFLEAKLAAGTNVTITPSSDTSGQHLVIAANIDTSAFLSKSQNLADLPNAAAARANLGLASVAASGSYPDLSNKPTLGSAAAHAATDFATATQGAKADSALQSSDIGVSVQAHNANLDWTAVNLSSAGKALASAADAAGQRSSLGLATVAASGSYTDLSNKPSLGSAAALNVVTDPTLAANSDSLVPSEKAVKTYVDAVVLPPQTQFLSLEKQVLRQALSSAISGNTAAESLFNGLCDAFTSDTIGANSSGQTYDATNKLYYNNGSPVQYTPTGAVFGNMTINGGLAASFDGTTSKVYTSCSANLATNPAYVGKAFASAQAISQVIVYGANNGGYSDESPGNMMTLSVYGKATAPASATDGTLLGSLAAFADSNATNSKTITCSGAAYSYVWVVVSNGSTVAASMAQVQYFTGGTPPNMTLVSNAVSPSPASAPTLVKLMVLWKDLSASAVLNTDLTAEATRDGSTWSAETLADTGLTISGFKLLWAAIDVSAQPSGTTVKYRLKTFNTKAQQVKGVAVITT